MKVFIGLALIVLSFIMIFLVTVIDAGWKAALIGWAVVILVGATFSAGLVLIYKD